MTANIASILILGVARFFIDRHWGVEAFGKVSFTLSLGNFALAFVAQISMVLFPMLRQNSEEQQQRVYCGIKRKLDLFLPIVLCFYCPIYYLVILWLPQYMESLRYMAVLLSICVFDAKMQMLCNTYLKVLRKEKVLRRINFVGMLASLVLAAFGTYVLNSMNFVVLAMLLSIALRSVISEIYLAKYMGISTGRQIVEEIVLALVFSLSAWFLPPIVACAVYCSCYGVYLLYHYLTSFRSAK